MMAGDIDKKTANKTKRTFKWMVFIVLGMFAFGYALVPMYRVICQATGINGRIYGAAKVQEDTVVDESRVITVRFLANNNADLPWEFKTLNPKVMVHPGQVTRIAFYAKNNADHTMTVQAVPSIAPGLATKYLRKTECFCFTQQTLAPGEALEMPMLFHLDAEIPKEMETVTLSYTLFDTAGVRKKSSVKQGRIG
jgi:cytochrome c oxidase assembly protein subunit 11